MSKEPWRMDATRCAWCNRRFNTKPLGEKPMDVYVFRKTADGTVQLHEQCLPKWDQAIRETVESGAEA